MAKSAQELLDQIPHISVTQAADRLGVERSRVKQLVNERRILALRGPSGLRILEESLAELPAQEQYATELSNPDSEHPRLVRVTDKPVAALRGTVILLEDGGFSNEEVVDWLWSTNPLLERRAIDLLRSGAHKAVNRLAATQAW